jgi:hypothetical protein
MRPSLGLSTIVCVLFATLPAAPATPEAPSVLLNHFFVVTDASTYAAAQASPFLTTEFAAFEKRTTVRNDQTYTGIYFYGRHTYFELFEPDSQGPEGSSGIAFGVETPGASAGVEARWAKDAGGADHGPVTRKTETDEVPWFEMTFPKSGGAAPARGMPFRLWLMEYDRDFLARWYPALTPARGITRADVLDRYVAKVGQSPGRATFLMKDVVSLVISLPDEDRGMLLDPLRAVGYGERADKADVVLTGPDAAFRLVHGAAPAHGIVEVEFSLQRKVPLSRHRIGNAVLTLDGERAKLTFAAGATTP